MPMGNGELLSRRRLIGGLGLASFGLGSFCGGAAVGAANEASVDLQSPDGLLTALVRMRGRLDEQLAFIWTRGVRYTLIDGEATPLCGYLGLGITRYRRLGDAMFEFLLYELSYYTDLQSGDLLERVQMPVTGREVKVPLYRTGPGRHVLMIANTEELDWNRSRTTSEAMARQLAPDAKVHYTFNVRPAVIFNGNVWIRNDSFTRLVPLDATQARMSYKEAFTYQARQADLAARDAAQVDTSISFALATSFRPWMQMAGINGHTMTDGIGGKVSAIREVPEDLLRLTATHHPDVLDDPAALFKPAATP